MKKIRLENGTEVCYVQKKDILAVSIFLKMKLPTTVFDIYQSYLDYNEADEYLRFDKNEIVNYFKNEKWILNYDDISSLSYQLIENIGQNMLEKIEMIRKQLIKSTDFEEISKLKIKEFLLEHQLKAILDVLSENKIIKKNIKQI